MWVAVVAAFLIVSITIAGVVISYRQAQDRVQQQILVTRLEGGVVQEEVIAWGALTERQLGPTTIGELESTRRRTDAVVSTLIRSGGGDAAFEIRDLLASYRAAVGNALRFLAAGQVDQAYAVDRAQLDPALRVLREAMAEASLSLGYQAGRASRRAAETSSALVASALLALGLLAFRVDRTRRQSARLAGEHDALRRSEARFRSLVQNSSDMISIFTADGTLRYTSPTFERVLGYRPAAILGRDPKTMVHPDDVGGVREAFIRALQNPGVGHATEFRAKHRNGAWRHLDVIMVNLLAEPDVDGIVANARDVTERKQTEQALREAETRYRALVEQVPAVTYMKELNAGRFRFVYVSPQVAAILGWPQADWLNDPEHRITITHPDDRERVLAQDARAEATGEPFRLEYRQRTRDGRYVWVHDEAVPILDERGVPHRWQGVLFDITERREREARLTHRAFHDPLTGLPNRALFMDRLSQALAAAPESQQAVAVLFLDLDRFKEINDGFGHETGDRLLSAVGQRLQAVLRPQDMLARLGGDEFTILLDDVSDSKVATDMAERILEQLRPPFMVNDQRVTTATSIGIAISDGHDSPDDTVCYADLALYAAKRKGSGHVAVFDPAMTVDAESDQRLEVDLRGALHRGEVQLYYQPVVDLATGRLLEVEALVRWAHPDRGLLPPTDFLEAAERVGLAVPLGQWVLGAACLQAQRWRGDVSDGSPLPVSVNVSPHHLREPTFATDVARALHDAGLAPDLLKLEIGETDLLEYADEHTDGLQALKDLGVGLVVDNFGTDHAGLRVLTRMPIDTVKIDHEFVGGLGRDRDDAALVRAVVGFARSLGLTVAAEGVETADQVRELRALGCDRGQGFYFARPRPGDEIGSLLAHPAEWARMLASFTTVLDVGGANGPAAEDAIGAQI